MERHQIVGTYTLRNYRGNSWRWRPLFGNVYGQYATQITGNILFHSVPYTEPNNSSLEYWEYDKLGTSASMGCVRLTTQNAKWIWDNCVTGTKVTFYNNSNPGPLGKPTEAKISWNEECRNWDPTDPSSNNPWKTYNSQKPQTTPTPIPTLTPTPSSTPSPTPSPTSSPMPTSTPTPTPTPTPPNDDNEIKDDTEVPNNSINDLIKDDNK